MPLRLSLALVFAFGLFLRPADAMSADKVVPPISVAVPGGALTEALRLSLAKYLAAADLPANFAPWDGELSTLQQREASSGGEPDILLAPTAVVLAACREGLLIPLDWSALGVRSDHPDASTCGLPGFKTSLVLAWDKTRDQTAPGWGDFWDVARYPGKRGLPLRARGTLEIALMADGVATADVYRVLASGDGVARAFRKLDQLRPYVVWWTDGDVATRALRSGRVLMTAAPATYGGVTGGQTGSASVGQQWAQALGDTLSWAVPRRATHLAAAWQFLRQQQQPEWQAGVTSFVPVIGAARGVESAIGDDLLARTAAAPHRAEQMLAIDDAFWGDHPELSSRFETWLAAAR